MLKNESKRKGSCKALLGILALLALVVVLENLNLWFPASCCPQASSSWC